jgi:hypothetical protein
VDSRTSLDVVEAVPVCPYLKHFKDCRYLNFFPELVKLNI